MVWQKQRLDEEKALDKREIVSVSINKGEERMKLNKLKEVFGIENDGTALKKAAFLVLQLPFLLEILPSYGNYLVWINH